MDEDGDFVAWGLRGAVVHGQGRGGLRLGFPTANIDLPAPGGRSIQRTSNTAVTTGGESTDSDDSSDFYYRRLMDQNSNKVLYGWACIEGRRGNDDRTAIVTDNDADAGGDAAEGDGLTHVLPMVMSLGINPHFNNNSKSDAVSSPPPITAEVHLITSDRTPLPAFYGSTVRAAVLGVMREQEVYPDDGTLIEAIRRDVDSGLSALSVYHEYYHYHEDIHRQREARAAAETTSASSLLDTGAGDSNGGAAVFNHLITDYGSVGRAFLRSLERSDSVGESSSGQLTDLFDLSRVRVVRDGTGEGNDDLEVDEEEDEDEGEGEGDGNGGREKQITDVVRLGQLTTTRYITEPPRAPLMLTVVPDNFDSGPHHPRGSDGDSEKEDDRIAQDDGGQPAMATRAGADVSHERRAENIGTSSSSLFSRTSLLSSHAGSRGVARMGRSTTGASVFVPTRSDVSPRLAHSQHHQQFRMRNAEQQLGGPIAFSFLSLLLLAVLLVAPPITGLVTVVNVFSRRRRR